MDIGQILTIVGPALAIGGALVAITRYVTNLQAQLKYNNEQQDAKARLATLEQDARLKDAEHARALKDAEEALAAQRAENAALNDRCQKLVTAGNAPLLAKSAIDEELGNIATAVGALAWSILVPVPTDIPGDMPGELVFLSLIPDQPELRGVRFPMSTLGGQVFSDRQAVVTVTPETGGFSGKVDAVTRFTTKSMLAIPLFHRGRCVGVAEFLNKRTGLPFDITDREDAEGMAAVLGRLVGDFCGETRNMEAVGITARQRPTEATILVSDLSNSSELARQLDASVVVDLMNQYFEAMCDIGMAHGGTIDQFLGDGFMMTFGIRRSLPDHPRAAFAAATAMQERFADLRRKWTTLQYPAMATLFNRISLSYGPVRKAEMGHSQFRQITVMGNAVNTAAHLCEAGARDGDVIVIDQPFLAALKPAPTVVQLTLPPNRHLAGPVYRVDR